MGRRKDIQMNARLETRLLAMGVADSVYRLNGRLPAKHDPWPRLGSYALWLLIGSAVIAWFVR